MSRKMLVGKAIKFNPSESIQKGDVAKKIPMGALTELQKKINSFEYSEYNNGPKFRNEDTIVAKITPCLENGKTAFVDILDDDEIAFGSSEFIVLRKTEFTDSGFIYYFARSPLFRERAINCMEGTSGRKRVNENTLKNLEFVFPDLTTQKSIAKVLSDLDTKIELNNRINRVLEAMAKTLYDYWFVQFDFPNEQGKPYKSSGGKMVYNAELKREIPEGWTVDKIHKYVKIGSGYPFDSKDYCYDGKYKVITIKNVQAGELDSINVDHISIIPNNISKYCVLQTGDILMSLTGNVGRMCLVDQKNLLLNQRVGKLLGKKDMVLYTYFFFDRPENQKRLTKIAGGSSQANLSPIDAVKENFVIPSKESLELFVKTTEPLINYILGNKTQNQQLSALRDWLLPMLMNGQVTVK